MDLTYSGTSFSFNSFRGSSMLGSPSIGNLPPSFLTPTAGLLTHTPPVRTLFGSPMTTLNRSPSGLAMDIFGYGQMNTTAPALNMSLLQSPYTPVSPTNVIRGGSAMLENAPKKRGRPKKAQVSEATTQLPAQPRRTRAGAGRKRLPEARTEDTAEKGECMVYLNK